MSYEKERAIAEAATPGKRDVIERRTAIGVRVWRDGKDHEIADYYESVAEAEFAAMCTREFVLGLLDKLEEAERLRRFVRHGSVCELRWRDGSGCDCGLADALNPTDTNDCAACRREGRCDVHLRLDTKATEDNDE